MSSITSMNNSKHTSINNVGLVKLSKTDILYLLAIFLFTYIAFSPSLNYGFVNWDDDIYVTENHKVKNPNSENITSLLTESAVANYHPVTMLSLALNYKYGGLDASSYHWINLVFHLFNVVLVFFLIRMLAKNNSTVALITAAIFALHPMHVESVAWVSSRKDVLYTFFYLLALICYCHYVLRGKLVKGLTFTMLFFLLSLLSKPAAVIFPLHLVLLDYCLQRKINFKSLLEKIPFLLAAIWLGILTIQAQEAEGAVNFDAFTIWERIQLASYSFMTYVVKFLWPYKLSSFYPYPSTPFPIVYKLAPIFCVSFFALVLATLKKSKQWLLGVTFFTISIVLILQIITVGSAIVADRYTYLAYIGLAFILACGVELLKKNARRLYYKTAIGIVVLISLTLGWMTHERVQVWQNGETLWSDVINKFPQVAGAWGGRGVYYRQQKTYELAVRDFNQAIALDPNEAMFYSNRGNIFFDLQQNEQALKDYNSCLILDSEDKDALANRGAIYGRRQQWDLALKDLTKAIELDPNFFNAYMNRAVIYGQTNRREQAISDYQTCLTLDPGNHEILNAMAIEFQYLGNFQASIPYLTKAIKLAPSFGLYYKNRGISYQRLDKKVEALRDFNQAKALGVSVSQAYFDSVN